MRKVFRVHGCCWLVHNQMREIRGAGTEPGTKFSDSTAEEKVIAAEPFQEVL